jgi:hypothetical protein
MLEADVTRTSDHRLGAPGMFTPGGRTAIRSAAVAAGSGHTAPQSYQSTRGGATAVGCN